MTETCTATIRNQAIFITQAFTSTARNQAIFMTETCTSTGGKLHKFMNRQLTPLNGKIEMAIVHVIFTSNDIISTKFQTFFITCNHMSLGRKGRKKKTSWYLVEP